MEELRDKLLEINNNSNEIRRVFDQFFPKFISEFNNFHKLVFANDFQIRATEYYNLRASVFDKALKVRSIVDTLIPFSTILINALETGTKIRSEKRAKKILSRFNKFLRLYIKLHEIDRKRIKSTDFDFFAPYYGEIYASPQVSKRREEIIRDLQKIVQECHTIVRKIEQELPECIKIFLNDIAKVKQKIGEHRYYRHSSSTRFMFPSCADFKSCSVTFSFNARKA